jgi:hypothetical protein
MPTGKSTVQANKHILIFPMNLFSPPSGYRWRNIESIFCSLVRCLKLHNEQWPCDTVKYYLLQFVRSLSIYDFRFLRGWIFSTSCGLGHRVVKCTGTSVVEKHTTSTLRTMCSSEMLVPTYNTTLRHNTEDHNTISDDSLWRHIFISQSGI